jgi:hypothetical protein
MEELIRPGNYSMIESCGLRLIDAKLSQMEGSQGIEETLTLMEEIKSEINSKKDEVYSVMK